MHSDTFARYAASNVPRYTSYPTAPAFSPEVGEDAYRTWLASLDGGADASVYIHVPFCRAMCLYCGCHTTVTRREEPVERYLAALALEIDLVRAATPAPPPADQKCGPSPLALSLDRESSSKAAG